MALPPMAEEGGRALLYAVAGPGSAGQCCRPGVPWWGGSGAPGPALPFRGACSGAGQTQRKRRGGAVSSRQAQKRNRLMASTAEMASEAEPIELEESAGEEVVDLTCESSEPVVVDLTHNDSVVIVEENQQQRRNLRLRSQRQSDSCVLSSDDEDETRDNDVYMTDKVSQELGPLEDETASSKPSGTVSCPICMDGYSEIVQSGRLIVSTKCGHVFCSQCLRDSLRNANSCPTCRKKLTHRQYHPIYI
ncbi:E3 ubiquitin-protein ligase RNF4 isoform X1 [Heliangelus exortis]|uniref:E3 ubiquitin-protein ligase RNF4 isoform X1 n=1 Tax=Heliangelus exortis TaxID=472823 RepID=UPI003A94EBD5